MNSEQLVQILDQYISSGIVKGVEFLLTPYAAIPYIDDLAELGIKITGCDLWRYLEGASKEPKNIVALLGAGLLVSESKNPGKGNARGNAEIVKAYISKDLPPDAELISLIYEDDEIYDYFKEKPNSVS